MKCLLISDGSSDFSAVLRGCGADITRLSFDNAMDADLPAFDAFVILARSQVLDARFRADLESEVKKGKRIFTEALSSFSDIYSADPVDTTRSRLMVCGDSNIPGLFPGDLLDDQSNRAVRPWYGVPDMKALLVYGEHITAHRHIDDIAPYRDAFPALFTVGNNIMMCTFEIHNFNRARFAPRRSWQSLVSYICKWITGSEPFAFPEPVVTHTEADDKTAAIDRGISFLKQFLIDDGRGGISEGLRHNISPDGDQAVATAVRTDCSGEAAGAFLMYGLLKNDAEYIKISDRLFDFVFGPMQINGGLFDGMLRWTDTAWEVCYQDDVARAVLPALYRCVLLKDSKYLDNVCRALDFLVKTTAKDGCRVFRTDKPNMTEHSFYELQNAEHGLPSAHYNAYYHAALLLAHKICGHKRYLDTAVRGLETIMSLYPETHREQSETQELCRLILPLALLYDATKEKSHLDMLCRVTDDLEKHRHPFGGYAEWDTGYKAACSRRSQGECSLLTENGDPVADLLYSNNWLSMGFYYAYRATGDARFFDLWKNICSFYTKTQVISDDRKISGMWCRAFDMDSKEIYGCPHDVGWAAALPER